MLNEMSNDKFIELFGGNIKNKSEFHEKELWDQNKVSNIILGNIVNKSIENKKNNKSLDKIKLNNSDIKYNQIQIEDDNKKYITYNLNNLVTDVLKNNILLTKKEHKDRLTDDDYLLRMLLVSEMSKSIEFKKGFSWDFKSIIEDCLIYSVKSLDKIKNK